MVGWHHQLNKHELEQALGGGEGQGSLVCCSPWGCKGLDTTEQQQKHQKVKRRRDYDGAYFSGKVEFSFFETFILRPSANGAENSEGKTENSQVNQKTEGHETEALLSAHEREQVNFGRKKNQKGDSKIVPTSIFDPLITHV